MRLSVVFCFLLASSLATSAGAAESIVFVGNSFTFAMHSTAMNYQPNTVHNLNGIGFGGVPALFKQFTTESRLDYDVSIEAVPDKSFDFHLQQKAGVLGRAWDHVVMQGYSTLDKKNPGDATELSEYAGKLAELFRAKNPKVDIRLVATWSRADLTYMPNGHWYGTPISAMALDVRAGYDQAAKVSPAIHAVIPVGQAWNRAIESQVAAANPYEALPKDQVNLWAPDHYHGSTEGYYLEALVIFGNITGRDPRSLGSQEKAAAALGIKSAVAAKLQQVAAETLAAEVPATTTAIAGRQAKASGLTARNVVLIVSDGLRWQEVFQGADPLLLDAKNGGNQVNDDELKRRYWRETPQERRQVLMPFLWGTIAKQGQLYGNRSQGSDAHVTNGKAFSYPGYDEMSVGYPNPNINSNEFGPNPDVSVFEWLNGQSDLTGHVGVYATWNAFVDIFNPKRSHLTVQAGWMQPPRSGDPAKDALITRLIETTSRQSEEDIPNALLQVELLDYVRISKPRVLFVGFGETDFWAHQGRYDMVLDTAHRTDGFIKELWDEMQSMPEYHDNTTFIITADHGRGSGPTEWKEHGVDQKGSENVWIAVIGPDTPSLGERTNIEPVTQAQIAASVAAVVGRDYRKDVPRAAAPIKDVLKKNE